MDTKELQDLINSNRIDLRNLNTQQKVFLDTLIGEGVIESKPLDTMIYEQNEAAKKVAKDKNMYQDPIKAMTSDTLNRDKVAMYTDIGMMMAQLYYDRKRLAQAFLNPTKYVAELEKITSNFKNPLLNKAVVGLKQIVAMAKGFGPTAGQQALRTALTGSLGYTGGGLAYDLADEIARDQLDLKGKVGDKTYKEMMDKNQLLRSLDDFRTALTFNAGAELLGPITSSSMYGLRKMMGLESQYSRQMAEIAKSHNLKATYIMLADPNSAGGKILKGINRIFGQLPYIGKPAKEAQLGAIEHFNQMSRQVFELQPGMHLATAASASERTAQAVLKNYERFRRMNDINYQRVINLAKTYGDPRVIELSQVRSLMNSLRRDALAPPEIKAGFEEFQRLRTPFGQFYDAYEKLVASNRKISITEYMDLRRLLNQTTDQLSKNDAGVATYTKLQNALETDFAKMDLNPGTIITQRFPVESLDVIAKGGNLTNIEKTSTIAETGLTEAAKRQIKEDIEFANKFYADNMKTFDSITARKISAFDENALSLKQIEGFIRAGSMERDQVLAKMSKNIFQMKNDFSFNAVQDLQKLIGADEYTIKAIRDAQGNTTFKTDLIKKGTRDGNETLRRLWGAHVGNAYQMSFRPVDKNQMGDWIQGWMQRESKAAQAGNPYKTLDEMTMPNGLPAQNIGPGNVYFDADIFRKMVIPNEAAAVQMRTIFGNEKANKLLKQYDDMLSYMDMVKSYVVPEASTFLARRLVLSGPNIAVGAGAYGMGFFPMAAMLFLGNRANKILSNPNAMEVINSSFKNFLENPGKGLGLSTQSRIALAKIANQAFAGEYPDDFKFDESDASMEEIFRKLSEPTPIDPLNNLSMNPDEEERLYPKLTDAEYEQSIDTLPPPEYLFDKIGGPPINAEEEAMMARAINTMPENQEINQQTLPRVQGLRMPGSGVNPVDYSNLFPFDPLGNLISQRKENV
jgi:hypothetical protein